MYSGSASYWYKRLPCPACRFVQGRVGGLDYDLMPSLCLSQDTDEQRRLVLATLKPDNPLFFTSIIETKVSIFQIYSYGSVVLRTLGA